MNHNYFIIHGSFSSPQSNWFPWLSSVIKEKGDEAYVPHFPAGVGYQTYENWSNLMKYYLNLGLINERTTIIGHSIAPVFICKFLIENKIKVRTLIFVCGFNNYYGINEEYDTVNGSMYMYDIEEIDLYADRIVCFYTNNDPYVRYDAEKDFADRVTTEQVLIPDGGHINSESGYDTFPEILNYLY